MSSTAHRRVPFAIIVVCLLAAGALLFYAVSEVTQGWQPAPARASGPSPALHTALLAGNAAAIKAELDRNPDVDAPMNSGDAWQVEMTPLMVAAFKGDAASMGLLMERGAKLDTATREGKTALYFAGGWGGEPAVKRLLEAGARVDARTTDGWTGLMMAASRGEQAALEALLRAGANVDIKNKWGQTALFLATTQGDLAKVEALLRAGASVNIADNEGNTPLSAATQLDNGQDVMRLLIDAKADVNAADLDGITTLMRAADRGEVERVVMLLSSGANAAAKDRSGRTAMDWARARDDELGREVVRVLQDAARG